MTYTNEKKLIQDAQRIIAHHNEVSRLKGENFNVFSILNMEHKENGTHSAFLGELLNPNGSHSKGNLFLQLFLQTIDNNTMNWDKASVILEKHIGFRDDANLLGGRVDIYITDQVNSICIENKIYASDQNVQLQRYCNHNKENNTVYYLTLNGSDASSESKGELIADRDYYRISYKNDIIDWLETCLKESAEEPILRESIRQYIILIKRLTNQLTDKAMEKEMHKLVKENYNAAQKIGNAISDVEREITKQFVDEIAKHLEMELDDDWNIQVDDDLNDPWTGITINNDKWPENIAVKLEGQSKIPWQKSIYGIIANKDKVERAPLKEALGQLAYFQSGFRESNIWPYNRDILYFDNVSERSKLFNASQREELIEFVKEKLLEICKASEAPLASLKAKS
ncbi:PD-(D/E)XK nuclease family protein [Flagellimonas halotolerans]|uniref:PD-(D/E)XK nuclease family protein n=1 Tax=Flagellimonas halotolerans TaxID=3112164 RepID=A0ABU6IQX5_9FLAO|nr:MULTISPECIES: PD-(D/E)XK nuclease family protein [unclassified Allomuricauda]MEC3965626.1 PD-(D/E)XK nuclease family protein [Muricauda sp. SYSU M86414]MEC4265493.1 PD-(D/E)XK nuclease family protein [Muricauda sp. SYSU M84420]